MKQGSLQFGNSSTTEYKLPDGVLEPSVYIGVLPPVLEYMGVIPVVRV